MAGGRVLAPHRARPLTCVEDSRRGSNLRLLAVTSADACHLGGARVPTPQSLQAAEKPCPTADGSQQPRELAAVGSGRTPHCSLSWVARGDPQAQAKWRCAALFLGHFVKGSQARHWQKNWLYIKLVKPTGHALGRPGTPHQASAAQLGTLSIASHPARPVHLGRLPNGWALRAAGSWQVA